MTDLLKGSIKGRKEGPFIFGKEAMDAFNALKEAFSAVPVLCYYDPRLPSRVETDASGQGLAGMISQPMDNCDDPKQCHY